MSGMKVVGIDETDRPHIFNKFFTGMDVFAPYFG